MKPRNDKSDKVLWTIAAGFSFMAVMSWLTELLRIPHYLFHEPFAPNWHRALLRTIVIGLIWLWVHLLVRRLLQRLHYFEEFLRICSWCRKVCHDGEWLEMERYFNSKFAARTSHSMCPECLQKGKDAVDEMPAASPE